MDEIQFDARLLPIIEASDYPKEGYWVPVKDRKNPLPPEESLPVDSSYQRRLARLAFEKKPKRIVEIGSQFGSTIIPMLMNCDASAICIDIFAQSTRAELEANLEAFGLLNRVVVMAGDSRTLLPAVMLAYKPDMVHIDGDHTYPGALHDLAAATEVKHPPKWIAMHDLLCAEVAAAWDAWHSFYVRSHQWNTEVELDIHNHPGFLELIA